MFFNVPTTFIGASELGVVSPTLFSLNTQGVIGTSGAFLIGQLGPKVSQLNASVTLYFWIGAVTGSPTDNRLVFYDISTSDGDRRGTTQLGISGATDWSGKALSWASISIASMSLSLLTPVNWGLYNNLATAASNYVNVAYRGGYRFNLNQGIQRPFLGSLNSTVGWPTTADPTIDTYTIPYVMKYGDGTIVGMPYPYHDTVHLASNQNYRGMQITPNTDIEVFGAKWQGNTANDEDFYIAKSNGTVVFSTLTLHRFFRQAASGIVFAPVILEGGTTYHILVKPQVNTTGGLAHYYMGESSPPADVLAAKPYPDAAYVYGSTLGALTIDNTRLAAMELLVNQWPQTSRRRVVVC